MRSYLFHGAVSLRSPLEQQFKGRAMKCPICGEPTEWKENPNRPFCSERCKTIDLANWASEGYRVPSPLKDSEESVPEPDQNHSKET